MPELPEVETTKRGIASHITNQKITSVSVRESRLRWPVSTDLSLFLRNKKVHSVSRRAKYLLLEFEHGYLIIHLGMSGSLRICNNKEEILKHDHIILYFGKKLTLRFNDPRRFGCMIWTDQNPNEHKLLNKLGPEPFDTSFNADYLFKCSRKRKVSIKQFIMDNQIVVGVGNIYANEALFLSGIRPRIAAGRITQTQFTQLTNNIIRVLSDAIAMGGTTLKDFVGGDGKPGYFQQTLCVYNRQNEPCIKCKSAIKHIIVGQRSTYYCPKCQC